MVTTHPLGYLMSSHCASQTKQMKQSLETFKIKINKLDKHDKQKVLQGDEWGESREITSPLLTRSSHITAQVCISPKLPPRAPWFWRLLSSNNLIQTSVHINFLWAPCPWITPIQCPMSEVKNQESRNADVCGEKITHRPFRWEEDCEPIYKCHQCSTCEAKINPIRLQL